MRRATVSCAPSPAASWPTPTSSTGPPGVGKRGAALGVAMALNCAAAPGTGCGVCDICRRIEAGLHPDVQTFGPSGAANQIVVEDAKAVLALARTRPHEGRARVIVLDDADALNPNAGNSLLKTLEEPLGGNHLVLCTGAPDKLLPTIRSRTQRIRFRPLTTEALLSLAAARDIPPARAEIAAALADGSAARLLAALGEEEGDPAEGLAALRAAVTTPGASGVFDFAAAIAGDEEGKQDLPRLLALVARLYRDALALAAGAPELVLMEGRRAGRCTGRRDVPPSTPARAPPPPRERVAVEARDQRGAQETCFPSLSPAIAAAKWTRRSRPGGHGRAQRRQPFGRVALLFTQGRQQARGRAVGQRGGNPARAGGMSRAAASESAPRWSAGGSGSAACGSGWSATACRGRRCRAPGDCRRGLLERVEQAVARVGVQRVGVVEHDHPRSPFVRAGPRQRQNGLGVLDDDLVRRPRRAEAGR